MHTVLTICAGFITIVGLAIVVLAINRIERLLGQCEDHANDAESAKLAMLEDRHRLTSVERDVAATRRELRKLSGKFYAEQRARDEDSPSPPFDEDRYPAQAARWREAEQLDTYANDPIATHNLALNRYMAGQDCENWKAAQNLGPTSEAAKCECLYCMTRRSERSALRAALVPKTVQGQAETAKLNAGKP